LRELTQHLTTRADDSHAAPNQLSLAGKRDFAPDQLIFKPR
jgi:hypothetical protein